MSLPFPIPFDACLTPLRGGFDVCLAPFAVPLTSVLTRFAPRVSRNPLPRKDSQARVRAKNMLLQYARRSAARAAPAALFGGPGLGARLAPSTILRQGFGWSPSLVNGGGSSLPLNRTHDIFHIHFNRL